MSIPQVVVEQTLPSEDLVRRYPVLRNIKSTKLRMIEDALADAAAKHASQPDFAPSRFTEKEMREAVDFYNHVVRDGRYIGILGTDPEGAAKLLGIPISAKIKEILAYAKFIAPGVPVEDGGDYAIAIAISVVVSIVILAAANPSRLISEQEAGKAMQAQKLVMLDRSGQIKY